MSTLMGRELLSRARDLFGSGDDEPPQTVHARLLADLIRFGESASGEPCAALAAGLDLLSELVAFAPRAVPSCREHTRAAVRVLGHAVNAKLRVSLANARGPDVARLFSRRSLSHLVRPEILDAMMPSSTRPGRASTARVLLGEQELEASLRESLVALLRKHGAPQPAIRAVMALIASVEEENRAVPFQVWALFAAEDSSGAGLCSRLAVSLIRRGERVPAPQIVGPVQVQRRFRAAVRAAEKYVSRRVGERIRARVWLPPVFSPSKVEGGSIGLATALAMLARHTGRRVGVSSSNDVAVTGALRNGRVVAVQGIESKLGALLAHAADPSQHAAISAVVVPRANYSAAERYRRSVSRREPAARALRIHGVETLEEAIALVLLDPWADTLRALTREVRPAPMDVLAAASLEPAEDGSPLLCVVAGTEAESPRSRQRRLAQALAVRLARRRLKLERVRRATQRGPALERADFAASRRVHVPVLIESRHARSDFRAYVSEQLGDIGEEMLREWASGGLHLVVHGLDVDLGEISGPGGRPPVLSMLEDFSRHGGNRVTVLCTDDALACYRGAIESALPGARRRWFTSARRTTFNADPRALEAWRPITRRVDASDRDKFFRRAGGPAMWMPTLVSSTRGRAEGLEGKPCDIADVVREAIASGDSSLRSLVVFGGPGSGKSTLTERLLLETHAGRLVVDGVPLVPWYLHAGSWREWRDGLNGLGELRLRLAATTPGLLVIVDGLNEVPDTDVARVIADFGTLTAVLRANPTSVLVAFSRPELLQAEHAGGEPLFDRLFQSAAEFRPRILQLLPPSEQDVRRHLGSSEWAYARHLRDALGERGELTEPLLVALVPIVREYFARHGLVPADIRRGHFYEAIVDRLIPSYEAGADAARSPQALTVRNHAECAVHLLGLIARRMVERSSTRLSQNDVEQVLGEFVRGRAGNGPPSWWPQEVVEGPDGRVRTQARSDMRAITSALARVGVFHGGVPEFANDAGRQFAFLHETLRDHFCAEHFRFAAEPSADGARGAWECWTEMKAFAKQHPLGGTALVLYAGREAGRLGREPEARAVSFLRDAIQAAIRLGALKDVELLARPLLDGRYLGRPERRLALGDVANAHRRQGRVRESNALFLKCVTEAGEAGDLIAMADALNRLSSSEALHAGHADGQLTLAWLSARFEELVERMIGAGQDGLPLAQSQDSLAGVIWRMGNEARSAGKGEEVRRLHERARALRLSIWERFGTHDEPDVRLRAYWALKAAIVLEEPERLAKVLRELLQFADTHPDRMDEGRRATVTREYAALLQRLLDLDGAAAQLHRALELASGTLEDQECRMVLGHLAALEERRGHDAAAVAIHYDHLARSRKAAVPGGVLSSLVHIGLIAARRREAEKVDDMMAEIESQLRAYPGYLETERGEETRMLTDALTIQRDLLADRVGPAMARVPAMLANRWLQLAEFRKRALVHLVAARAHQAAGQRVLMRRHADQALGTMRSDLDARTPALWVWELRELKRLLGRVPKFP